MEEIKLLNKNGKILASSREVAEKFGKRHDHVLRDITNLIHKNPSLSKHFTKTTYVNTRNKEYPEYILDEYSSQVMDFHYKYNVSSARLEYKILNELADFFNDLNIIYHTQFQVLSYKIDIYLSTYNLAIEIDEVYHKYRKGEDEKRQTEIENELQCDFVRIEENDSVGNAIAKIMNKIAVLKTDKNIA